MSCNASADKHCHAAEEKADKKASIVLMVMSICCGPVGCISYSLFQHSVSPHARMYAYIALLIGIISMITSAIAISIVGIRLYVEQT